MQRRCSRLCLWLGLAVALTGCAEDGPTDPTPLVPVEPITLDGVWDFTEVLVISSAVAVCRDTGSFTLIQDGQTFLGTGDLVGSCTGLVGAFGNRGPFVIEGGVVSDSSISFSIADGCQYIGKVSGGFPRRISGSSACSVNYDGSWEAFEGSVVSFVAVEPDSFEMVIGESAQLIPELRDISGARVFERPVSWDTSDPTVLTVDADGAAIAVGEGAATVTASVEGLRGDAEVVTESVSFRLVETGVWHSCGVSADGPAYCWGRNERGQSGPAVTTLTCSGLPCRSAPGVVSRPLAFSSISAGFTNTCGVAAGGAVYCWGSNTAGQLGDSSATSSATPVPVAGNMVFASVTVGSEHVCGLTANGGTFCWGDNSSGQLGIGPVARSVVPAPVAGGLRLASVTSGGIHSCGLAADGTVHCWGDNFGGQLGVDITTRRSFVPVTLAADLRFSQISAGGLHMCGISTDGVMYCWGENTDGQLGVDSLDFSPQPLEPNGGLTFVAVSSGAFHTCALTSTGAAYCWGQGESGQLGDGGSGNSTTPVAVSGGLGFESLTAGAFHTCGMSLDGRAYCWGSSENGQVGAASTVDSPIPVAVVGQP